MSNDTGNIPFGKYRKGGTYLTIRPNDPTVEMKVLDSTVEPSKFGREDLVLIVDVGGQEHKWRLNTGANRALDDAGVDVDDVIYVTRGDDLVEDGRTQSQWAIEVQR
jgi:hypothetical protein